MQESRISIVGVQKFLVKTNKLKEVNVQGSIVPNLFANTHQRRSFVKSNRRSDDCVCKKVFVEIPCILNTS